MESRESLPERERLLQALWSMKESIVKWNGRGMGYGMERVDCSKWLKPRPNAHCFTKSEQKTCLTQRKDVGGKQKFDSSVVGMPECENATLQKPIKEEIVCVRSPKLWMLLCQEPEYTLAACTAERKGISDDWPNAVQITKVREEELYK